MAQTLANGFVIPAQTDRISAAGVQEMRTLGASGDAVAGAIDFQSRARDADLSDLIAGMEGMTYVGAWESGRTYRINDVVAHGGDSWARLTAGASGEPGASPADWGLVARRGDGGGFGELSETDTPGLWEGVDNDIESRLDALSDSTGLRNVTASYPEVDATGQNGVFLSRVGALVQVSLYGIRVPGATGSSHHLSQFLPVGFRPLAGTLLMVPVLQGNTDTIRFRVTAAGQMTIYNHNGSSLIYGSVTFATVDARPSTRPGAPA